MKITHRSKDYVLLEDASGIKSWPKAVKMILHFSAALKGEPLPDEAAGVLRSEIGKFLGAEKELNEKGRRVFANDTEVLACAEKYRLDLAKRTPNTPQTSFDTQKPLLPATQPDPVPQNMRVGESVNQELSMSEGPAKPELASILRLTHEFLLRFMVFSEPSQAIAVTLWIAHTWVLDAFQITPYLHIYSPTKRCGKSRLLECLHALVCRAWSVVSATEATIMRKIDAESPTLLFDEIDTVYSSSRDKSKEGLRAVLNCGFVRGAKVPRCAGREIIEYTVFCAKAFAGIGDRLPDTVKDRCVRIQLIRRAKDQVIEKLRSRNIEDATKQIVEGLRSLAADEEVIHRLQDAKTNTPHELNDRAADIVEPLLAIAEMAGGEWPQAARSCLVTLLQSNDDEAAGEPGVRLLAAIRDIFEAEGRKQLPTIQILRNLATREEAEEWTINWPKAVGMGNYQGPAAKMASLLRPYGISGGSIRLPDGSTPKGYRLEAFLDAFARYLPEKLATTPHDIVDENTPTLPPSIH